jgi:hypothetical protein
MVSASVDRHGHAACARVPMRPLYTWPLRTVYVRARTNTRTVTHRVRRTADAYQPIMDFVDVAELQRRCIRKQQQRADGRAGAVPRPRLPP